MMNAEDRQNREIEFRGKKINFMSSEWVFGYYVGSDSCDQIVDSTGEFHKVLPSTLGQYTGLKDRKGNNVFEGDVIEIHHGDGNKTDGVVFYWERFFSVFLMMESGEPRCLFQEWESFRKCVSAYIQIIGNVFDNPDLNEKFGKYREIE